MANEFIHKEVGTQLTQAEWEHVEAHKFNNQATGDLVYASSADQLSKLGIGTAGKVLMVNSGASAPEWSAALTGVTSIYATDLIIGEDSQTAIDFGTANEIDFKVDNSNRLTLTTGALYPATDNQIDLGTSSLEFKDAFFDGTVTSDAFAGPLTGDVTGNVSGTSATVTTAAQPNITSLGTLTTLTVDNIIINGTNIGHTSDTDSIAIASDGVVTMNQIPVFSAGINVSGGSIAGTLSTASQTNITGVGTISTGTWQGTAIASTYIAADAITGAKIADDAINSEHYTDGSIDTAHIADNQVTLAKMAGLTRGSLIIGDSSGDPSALPKGSANYILTSDGTDIAWAAAPDATNSSHVLVTDNESTNEENLVTFVEGATSSTGNVGLEMDGNLTYNPSSGTLTATAFAGNITGNVTGNASGTALTVTQAAQSSITSLGTLTTLTVDNVIINGTTIGHTSDTDLLTLTSANLAVAGDLEVSGELQIADIGFTDGDNAMTIADGGGVTFAQNAVFSGTIDIGHATDTTLSGSSGVLSVQGTPVRTAGVEHIWVPATAMTPSESNGCGTLTTLETTAGRPDISHLPFDNTADENAQFSISLPKSWDETGDLTCTVYWTSSRDVSNEDVTWAIAPICFGNNDDVDTAFPTPTIITTDTAQGQEFMNITSSVAIDVAGSPAAGDLCFFEISRDVSDTDGTTLAADALLIGVKIFYTTNAATDA